MRKHAARVLTVALLGMAAAGMAVADPPPASALLTDPERAGPFPVGVTTYTFYDFGREDPHTGKTPRALKTEIWYPATDDARTLPRNRFSDFLDRGTNAQLGALASLALRASLPELDRRFRNDAVRDARWRDGPFPVLLFSHGNGAVRTQSVFWCEHMASHGYVVAAPDHSGNATATTVGGRLVLPDTSPRGIDASRKARPTDLRFLIDALGRLDKGDDSRFAGRLDMQRIGAAGHSFGAHTAITAADADPRIRAISPWASFAEPMVRTDVPVLLLLAGEDVALTLPGLRSGRSWFASLRGPRFLVEFRNAGHYSFSEMFQLRPDYGDGVGAGNRITNGEPITYVAEGVVHRYINAFTLAFFDRYLKGLAPREAYLAGNPMPEEIDLQGRPSPAAK